MLFSSPLFLFAFLPVMLGLYFILGPNFRTRSPGPLCVTAISPARFVSESSLQPGSRTV
jgi:hypothetical protein